MKKEKSYKKHERTTRGIVNKGFSVFRGVVTRFNISCILIGKKSSTPY
jgi:hypothetical protein